jgi:hypothetical protein
MNTYHIGQKIEVKSQNGIWKSCEVVNVSHLKNDKTAIRFQVEITRTGKFTGWSGGCKQIPFLSRHWMQKKDLR